MGELYRTVSPVVAPAAYRILSPKADRPTDPPSDRSVGMEGIRRLFDTALEEGLVTGRFRGLLHIAIGRTVSDAAGAVLSRGLTWREAAALLKELRFDRELVREFGADPENLPSPLLAAGSSFVSFAIGASLPILPFLLGASSLIPAMIISLVALFGCGALVSRVTVRTWWFGGLRQLILGGVAAGLTYLIGQAVGASLG